MFSLTSMIPHWFLMVAWPTFGGALDSYSTLLSCLILNYNLNLKYFPNKKIKCVTTQILNSNLLIWILWTYCWFFKVVVESFVSNLESILWIYVFCEHIVEFSEPIASMFDCMFQHCIAKKWSRQMRSDAFELVWSSKIILLSLFK